MNKIIVAVILVAVGILGGIALLLKDIRDNQLQTPVVTSLSATGSQFHIETEWTQDEYYTPNNYSTTTPESVATTTSIFIGAGASTTIEILTASVADLRLNLFVNSSSSLDVAPDITIRKQIIGNNGLDFYSFDSLSSNVVVVSPDDFWNVSTTTDTAAPSLAIGERTSVLYTNLDAPKMRFVIGSSQAVDMFVEFVKVIPN